MFGLSRPIRFQLPFMETLFKTRVVDVEAEVGGGGGGGGGKWRTLCIKIRYRFPGPPCYVLR